MITDLQIYSQFFDEKTMMSWTTSCNRNDGEIYTWNVKSVNITQSQNSQLNVSGKSFFSTILLEAVISILKLRITNSINATDTDTKQVLPIE